MVHLSRVHNCFTILLVAPFHYLGFEWPPGILVRTNLVFIVGEQGTQEVKRKGIWAVYITEYMEESRRTSCLQPSPSQAVVPHMLSGNVELGPWCHALSTHSRGQQLFGTQCLARRIVCRHHPAESLTQALNCQSEEGLPRARYPRTWPFHCSIRNTLEHEVKRILGG